MLVPLMVWKIVFFFPEWLQLDYFSYMQAFWQDVEKNGKLCGVVSEIIWFLSQLF